MHTKMNKHQNDPNFLTQDLWSKTKLGMQQIHLELSWILSYAFTNKIRHKTKLIISNRYKIMINSPEVRLSIKRSLAEVEHKNLVSFSYKNHLDRLSINRKQFIIKNI
jgi:hypothetical protein